MCLAHIQTRSTSLGDATCLLYARRGSVVIGGGDAVPRHALAYTGRGSDVLEMQNAGSEEADVLVLVENCAEINR